MVDIELAPCQATTNRRGSGRADGPAGEVPAPPVARQDRVSFAEPAVDADKRVGDRMDGHSVSFRLPRLLDWALLM